MKPFISAHKYSRNNKPLLDNVYRCGCFYCIRIFPTYKIIKWNISKLGDKKGTAICPYCQYDTVIPESDKYKRTVNLLTKMNNYWIKEVTL